MKKTILLPIILSVFMLASISISAQVFYPSVDTYLNQVTPDFKMNTDYPARIEVRKATSNNERIGILEFSIGSFNKQVTKAELNLYLYQAGNANNALKTEEIGVYDFSSVTIADNSTWTNVGAYTLGSALAAKTITITGGGDANNNNTSANGWYKFDIKSLVNTIAATSGADKRVKICLKNSNGNLVLRFFSVEAPNYTTDGQSTFPEPAAGKEPFLDVVISTGINAPAANHVISVFKNSNNEITVKCNEKLDNNASVTIYNTLGERITSQKITNATTTISKTLKTGAYFVKVTNAGIKSTQKVIVN